MADDDLREGLNRLAEAIEGQTERLAEATETLAGERKARMDAIDSERRTRRVEVGCVAVLLLAFAFIGWVEFDRTSTQRERDRVSDQQAQYQSCRRGNELRGAIPEAAAIGAETAIREAARLNLPPEEAARVQDQLDGIGDSVQAEVAALDGMALRNCDEILEGDAEPSLRPPATTPTTEGPAPGTTTEQAPATTSPPTSSASGPPSSCAEVTGPISEGDPAYSPDLDADGDGVACEG